MDRHRVLVTGATGFVGRQVVAAARQRPDVLLVLLTRRPPGAPGAPVPLAGERVVRADLGRPETLRGALDGVDRVVHCASSVNGDAAEAARVNDAGTAALVAEAARTGARTVLLSTAAVHGPAPFSGSLPDLPAPAALSPTSSSRLAAERHVRAAGGTVLRPHLVYGTGDRWVVPALLRLVRRLPPTVLGAAPDARHTLIGAPALGRALLAAALTPGAAGRTYHVGHPRPVGTAELLAAAAALLPRSAPPGAGTAAAGRDVGGGADTGSGQDTGGGRDTAHDLRLLTGDHWFLDERPRRDLGWDPGDGFAEDLPRHLDWYRRPTEAD